MTFDMNYAKYTLRGNYSMCYTIQKTEKNLHHFLI